MSDRLDDIQAELDAIVQTMDDPEQARQRLVKLVDDLRSDYFVNDIQRARKCAEQLLDISLKLDDIHAISLARGYAGFTDHLLGNHEKALEEMTEGLKLAHETENIHTQAQLHSGLTSIHLGLGNYEKALASAQENDRLLEKIGSAFGMAWAAQGNANAFFDFGDLEQSLIYYRKALSLFQAMDDDSDRSQIGFARALNGIGSVLHAQQQHEEALTYHEHALAIFRERNNDIGTSRALNDLGMVRQALKQFDEALVHFQESLRLREAIGSRQTQTSTLISLGRYYSELGQHCEAQAALHRALTLSMEINAKPRVFQTHLALSESYAAQGDFENSLAHYKLYHEVREQVLGDQAAARIRNLQVDFEVERSEREAEIERLRNVELREKNDELEQLLDELKRTQGQLVQSEKMAALGGLVAGIVHEMNSPLGAIVSSLDVAERCLSKLNDADDSRRDELESMAAENLRRAEHALERVSTITRSLKNFARLDEAKFQITDIHPGLESSLVLALANPSKDIVVTREFGDSISVPCYPGELNQAFINVLTNAVDAIKSSGEIMIATKFNDREVSVTITDDGVGISPEQQAHLFEPSFVKSGSRVKTGMGLFTVYNIMQMHQGTIKVSSEVGQGTTVILTWPRDLSPQSK